ncbi:50S ribosomal protein L32 [candidate division WWE3 bacterium RIFCSPLOWO2_01_FULL_39_13]|uniref:Large ribosomal subunit protein bL32 n=1 Tax=candidate division WWE3 bacterium RIFCSPLOWO2_01_FULL_39_13 TaxID=1802624 RepID=A0A1F4V4C4_UNCKA|nr:MAG: 50S ribosomal protein L32 [candidate division WWE3 bacterium RIFCSPLOWO2_01_FULL_39_13]
MSVPKRKKSKSRRNQHRSHSQIKKITTAKCHKCSAEKKPHTICPSCKTYS